MKARNALKLSVKAAKLLNEIHSAEDYELAEKDDAVAILTQFIIECDGVETKSCKGVSFRKSKEEWKRLKNRFSLEKKKEVCNVR